MHIIVIDDDPFALKLIRHQLHVIGFNRVESTTSAHDALARMTGGECFDLVITDLQMPELDGVEFVRRLTQNGFEGGLVLVSGEDERILQTAERLARAHELHVLGSLHKPIDPERLRKMLTSHTQPAGDAKRPARRIYGPEEVLEGIRTGQLECFCQPKVALASGEVNGVEMLVRWRHPRDGLVFPDQFIATAEEHGMIDELTRVVLRQALEQARTWIERGLHLSVAVNVSMESLSDLRFPDFVSREISRAGVPSSALILEVTESRLMKDVRNALDILARLRLRRVELSIDDFGTGHSTLVQLRDIPFTELKVDRGFVHGAWRHDSNLGAILEASLDMARRLGMRSVAEGVENQEDWAFLRRRGCDTAQGYFVARPMPMNELPDWLPVWEERCRDMGLSGP
ncbi:EAL domain-containing response regulator [Thioalkalivibrio thiocyanodenitrificans]|uniref:EAL domain-containing response regulator n=1 Tax=Thioalkalivibrio thiocyanodenitrificans TaxID=243063 RepID=UPI00037A5853|nr:EAL domain-containing response regulator [Thioalkalivibrio thiocyanodenitrificans]